MTSAFQGPLAGLRIIDMTNVLMGPFATQLLADLGADVIKVEPEAGDTTRQIPPTRNAGMSGTFMQLNRSKRSIVLNLKKSEDKDAFFALLRTADIFVTNVRPRALARLGLSEGELKVVAPRLISVSLVGYGQAGPYAADPAYEDLIQGMVAVPSMMVQSGAAHPLYAPISLSDRAVGVHAAMAMLAAVYAREKTGVSQAVEVPMFETMTQFVLGDHMAGRAFEPPVGPAGYNRILNSERRPFPTADGYICILVYTNEHWRRFGALTGQSERFTSDFRLADMASRTVHADAVCSLLAEIMADKTTDEWLSLLREADIPAGRLHSLDSLIDDPHHAATGFIHLAEHPTQGVVRQTGVPTRWSETAPGPSRPAPELGEHTEQILAEIGWIKPPS